jgi:hypothetical protein
MRMARWWLVPCWLVRRWLVRRWLVPRWMARRLLIPWLSTLSWLALLGLAL